MKKILLTQGKTSLIDEEDFDNLSQFKWRANKNGKTYYAISSGSKYYKMHRLILGLKAGDKRVADHINGDGLDNRRANLRITNSRGNSQNKIRNRQGKLVGAHKLRSGNFEARLWLKGKYKYLGVYESEVKAHKAYLDFVKDNV